MSGMPTLRAQSLLVGGDERPPLILVPRGGELGACLGLLAGRARSPGVVVACPRPPRSRRERVRRPRHDTNGRLRVNRRVLAATVSAVTSWLEKTIPAGGPDARLPRRRSGSFDY